MAKSNFIVRGGADFSGIKRALTDTQKQLNTFQSNINRATKRIATALGGIAVTKLVKDSVAVAMSVESSIDNISNTMKNNSKVFQEWVESQAKPLGLARSEAYKYGSTFSNLLDSFTSSAKETADQTQELMKAAAIIASKTGRTYDDTANRIRSGMLGSTEAIEDLGVYTQISMIETTEAFKKFANGRSWAQLDFKTQQQIRLAAILEQTYARYGDTLADTAVTRHNQFIASLKNVQLNIGNAFLPIYNAVLPALTAMANKIESATSVIASFMEALFGKSAIKNANKTANAVSDMTSDTENYTATAKDAAKAQDNLLGFDQITKLSDTNSSGGGGSAGSGGITVPGTDYAYEETESINRFAKVAERFKQIAKPTLDALDRLKNALTPFKDFVATGVMDFWNHFLKPVGKWTLGKGLPDLIDALSDLLKEIKWPKLNSAFKNFFKALGEFSISAGKGIVSFIKTLLKILTPVLSALVSALATAFNILAAALKAIPSRVVEMLGGAFAGMATSILMFNGITGAITNLLAFINKIRAMIQLADPVYLVVGAIGAFVGAIATLGKGMQDDTEIRTYGETLSNLKRRIEDVSESTKQNISKSREYVEKAGVAEVNMAKDLADRYYTLAGNADLSNAQKEEMKGLAQDLIELVPELSKHIDEETGLLVTQKDEVYNLITALKEQYKLEAMKETIKEQYKQQVEQVKAVKDAQNALSTAIEKYNKKIDGAKSAMGENSKAYKDFIKGDYGLMKTRTEVDNLTGTLENAQGAYDDSARYIDELADSIYGVGEQSSSVDYSGITDNLISEAKKAKRSAETTGKDVVDGFNKGINDNSDSSKKSTESWFTKIKNWWNGLWDSHSPSRYMIKNAANIVNGFNEGISGNSGTSQSYVSSWADKVKGWFGTSIPGNSFSANASSLVSGFNSGINGKQNTSSWYMSDWANRVKNWFSGSATYGIFSSYGANIVSGLNSGVSNNSGTTRNFITNWANNIKGWFTKNFEIKSPSRIFEGFGEFFVEGLNIGISDNMADTIKALKDWGNKITSWADGVNVKPIELGAITSLEERVNITAGYNVSESGNSRITQLTDDLANKIGNDNIGVNVYLQGDANGVFNMVRSEAIKFGKAHRISPFPV